MKNNFLKEISIGGILVLVLLLVANPFHFWMPTMMVVIILIVILITFGIYASFILSEKVIDEREDAHRALAGRVAYLSGSAVLIIATFIQEYFGHLDIWVVIALVVMILAKICTRMYTDSKY